jgi:hypothetical protein
MPRKAKSDNIEFSYGEVFTHILWEDAVASAGWEDISHSSNESPDVCEAAGYLMSETDLAVNLALTWDGVQSNGRLTIPRSGILARRDFKMPALKIAKSVLSKYGKA